MARPKKADTIENLKRQQADIAAKLKAAETAEREAAKELIARKKTLAGDVALWLADQEPNGAFAKALRAGLAARIKRAADRALFDLPGGTKETAAPVEAAA